ncbi:MAG: hypothetical protein PVJ07_09320 [Anaerolineales bacterium]
MESDLPQPDRDRLSVLAALVLITYTLLRLVTLPTMATEFSILGILFRFVINTRLVMLTLAAGLTSAGAAWLMRSHPKSDFKPSVLEHMVIPGLAALGLGSILSRAPEGGTLWIGLAVAAVLLIGLLSAEFVALDAEDPRYGMASLGLRFLAYLLLVGSLFALRATGLRAAFAVPIVLVATTVVAWRLLKLSVPHASTWIYAGLIGGIVAQLAWALHYWPTPPIEGALILGLGAYVGVEVVQANLQEGISRSHAIELAVVAGVALAAILIFA